METDIHFWSYLAQFLLEWEMFQTKVVEKIKTHILCSVTFSRKSCRLWDNVGKYCREGQAKDDNMARAHCMLDNQGYRHARSLNFTHQIMHFYIQVSQEEWTKLREGVPYVELYRYNPKHLYPKLNGYGDNGHRKLWASGVSTYCTPSVTPYSYTAHARQRDVTS